MARVLKTYLVLLVLLVVSVIFYFKASTRYRNQYIPDDDDVAFQLTSDRVSTEKVY